MKLAAFLLLLTISFVASEHVHFHGYSVLKYELTHKNQLQIVTNLGVDVWSHDSNPIIGINDIMVNEPQREELARHGIRHQEVMIADVEQLLASERESLNASLSAPQADFFDAYHPFADLVKYYQELAATYPNIAKYNASIGKTIEGRDIPALVIGNNPAKKIFFEGGQHAREWVGHSTVAYITTQLLTNTTAKDLIENIQFFIVPVVNPDGYLFTWSNNRLWRKNRRLNTGGSYGVDLNRNWNDHWGGDGSSGTPTSDTYRGTAPFSEPETKAVSDYYLRNGPYKGAIDYHSYSQLILRPYGWTTALPPNDATAKLVGDTIRDRIRATTNVVYTSQASWQLYYTAGTAQDWYYTPGATPLSYTIELRDTGSYGFELPAIQIRPTGQENWAGFQYFADYILKNN
jgi:murein tripeptide amidase MpaA